ncbi:membrane protein insertion efficiency factor YidD [Methylosinus sp. Sm6]|uniref:membrane protein insertion efficiency factor YidD n=1 Tax=Methylosinus sp. Sm6 TaxID=2866948 RepID=UPI001C98FEED|nr:membrane protein insertion efficiency factor YidD [Methylosinus sp. Sm6]MBY6241679.1 membrane protein insertion efficiency factor YidD [Methylosinus sp. Sm6]
MFRPPLATLARALILLYRLTLSAFVGRDCRYLPTCSEYADEAIRRHGLWAGGWMGLARVCRCRPGGGDGYDPVPERLAEDARAFAPWRYGLWRRPSLCDAVEDQERAISSTASPQMRSRTGSSRPRSASR